MSAHHPWEAFGRLTDWTLRRELLPSGVWGLTDFIKKTVTLAPGLSQAERRCTIAHETQHILRGPVLAIHTVREEEIVDHNASRLLLPDVRKIGEALAAHGDIYGAAEELWVDDIILQSRLRHLHPAELAWLKRRLVD